MRIFNKSFCLSKFVGLFATLLFVTGCSNSEEPKPNEPENEMVANLVSGNLSGEFNLSKGYFEQYDAESGEWKETGPLYGAWNTYPEKFSIIDGKMYYDVLLKFFPGSGLWAVQDLWKAYQCFEKKQIGLYVVKNFEVKPETLVFEDLHANPARIAFAENNILTIILGDMIDFPKGDGSSNSNTPIREVAQYVFSSSEAPDLTDCIIFESINEAYQYVIDCGRNNWEQIKIYMPEEYKDGVDFDNLEKRIKNSQVIF